MKLLPFIGKKKRAPTPKERVRTLMETASGYQWAVKRDADDALEFTSSAKHTPGLCIFANGEATLAPETRLVHFNLSVGDFAFDDAPEEQSVFDAKDETTPPSVSRASALRKKFKDFLVSWLQGDEWLLWEEQAPNGKNWANWTFKHGGRPRPIALGGVRFDNMPPSYQVNIETLCAPDAEDVARGFVGAFKLCISLVDHS